MVSTITKKTDYAVRDRKGKVVFYVLLWKRKGILLDTFDDYWRNVHGPVCARLPGQHQYWQFHLAHNRGGLWPTIEGIEYKSLPEDQFDGIAELAKQLATILVLGIPKPISIVLKQELLTAN